MSKSGNIGGLMTRRHFARGVVSLATSPLGTYCQGLPATAFELKLQREFKNAILLASAPDGKSICLYFAESRSEAFVLSTGRWLHKDARRSRDSLQVVALDTGNPVFSGLFRESVYPASFFADGKRLFVETSSFMNEGKLLHQQAIVDLRSGKIAERIVEPDPSTAFGFHAIRDEVLLVQEYDRKSKRSIALREVRWPECVAVVSSPYASREREEEGGDFEKFFSADRETMSYGFDHVIVCRRTKDLALLWTRVIDREYMGAWRLAVSADGRYIAAAVTDSAFSHKQKKYYVGVYGGKDGEELARLPITGTDGLAISSNGKLVATAEVVYGKRGAVPTVTVYDISSGVKVARAEHEPVTSNPFMNASFGIHGIEFTADGKYLITSTHDTRVWSLDGLLKAT